MTNPMSKKPTEDARLTLIDETEIVHGISQQLHALARVLTHVETGTGADEEPSSITPQDFVCIMQIFQEKLDSLEDIAGAVHATAVDLSPIYKPIQAV